MNVYIVEEEFPHEGFDIVGVYAKREDAEKFVTAYGRKLGEGPFYSISEHEIIGGAA